MKTLSKIAAVLTCLIAVSTASAQQRIQIAPTPMPAPQPTGSYFLGVYTSCVPLPYNNGPMGPVAMNQPRVQIAPSVTPLPSPVRYGQRVNSVVPGSPAAQIGLEPGDILVTGNNIPLSSKQSLLRAINSSGGYLQLQVINVRTGQMTPLTAYPQSQNPVAYTARR